MPFETPPVRPKKPCAMRDTLFRFDARRIVSMSESRGWRCVGGHDRQHLEQFAHLVRRDQPIEIEIHRWPAIGGAAALQGVCTLENSEVDKKVALSDWAVGRCALRFGGRRQRSKIDAGGDIRFTRCA